MLHRALFLGFATLPVAVAATQIAAGCGSSEPPDVIGQTTASTTTGSGGSGGSAGNGGASSASSGAGGAGTGGAGSGGMGNGGAGNGGAGGMGGAASSSSSGTFVDDAGAKTCPSIANTAAMVAVPGWDGKAYCIDATEVTNAQYAAWLESGPSVANQSAVCASNLSFTPPAGTPPKDDYPVGSVDWCDAFAYCKAVGKRLCGRIGGGPAPYYAHDDASRNQWFSACSHGGTQSYPYGQAYDANACNVKDAAYGAVLPVGTLASCKGGFEGLVDMSGNAWEWEDSCIPTDGGADLCRRRGGSFSSAADNVDCDVSSTRPRDAAEANTGFRCCAD
ncbi:SUMF1/EgtB/PvdO family nonheme iron enzyme [Polyangium sp. 6x1]|uniref:formylglycine-generating enzyme family protein n=1 Tax=Polyangium sp. 6x1 TaxID=3042689 RepID=UPI002482E888|nr:SUMF1/EgtB/PvdO family nonheme iron enzyme [Polyangium sp. 6x1]MDI1448766.1 SUMF1/EgtB/PvdO family nonheme iron enzyme [Polyangium sp. 6x1]